MVRALCLSMVLLCVNGVFANNTGTAFDLMLALGNRDETRANQLIDCHVQIAYVPCSGVASAWATDRDTRRETAFFKAIKFDCLAVTKRLCRLLYEQFGADFLMHVLRARNVQNFMALHEAAYEASAETLGFVIETYGNYFSTEELLKALDAVFDGYVEKHGFDPLVSSDAWLPSDKRTADITKRAACKEALCWYLLIEREHGGVKVQERLFWWHRYFKTHRISMPKGLFLDWKV